MPGRWRMSSISPLVLRILACAAALVSSGATLAQSSSCERYRAELASLGRGNAAARQADANAQRHRAEIGRLVGYYRSIGCDRGFLFFGRPAECGPINARIRALQASYQSIVSQAYADPYAVDVRRKQLRAAIAEVCDASSDGGLREITPSRSGERLVCVRSCDGSYFPLDSKPKGRQDPAAMCSALCPNAEVLVFRAPFDGGIEEARSESGKPYMELPNALKYRKAHDSSCTCKKADESWAQALQKAERMVARKKTDIFVTEAISRQMANPKLAKAKTRAGEKEEVKAAKASVAPADLVDPVTTGSIGAEASSSSPAPKKPRVIAPDIIPVPIP